MGENIFKERIYASVISQFGDSIDKNNGINQLILTNRINKSINTKCFIIMDLAFEAAEEALECGEVPVGCAFIFDGSVNLICCLVIFLTF